MKENNQVVGILAAEAKKWLKRQVFENASYSDFQILELVNTVSTVICDKHRGVSFTFLCSYNWRLNAWTKHVEQEIIVVYDRDLRQFVCASDPSIN